MRRPVLVLAALLACTAATAPTSRDATGAQAVRTVTISPDSLPLYVGDVGRATCAPRNKAGTLLTNPCTWRTLDTTIAKATTGSQSTSVTARTVGVTTLIATAAGKSDTIRVPVLNATTPTVKAIGLTPAAVIIDTSAAQAFTAIDTLTDNSIQPFVGSWSATGGTITPTGLYTAGLTAGSFHVIASESGKEDTAAVTVTAPTTSLDCAGMVRTITVTTTGQLTNAVTAALPGDCILLAAGTYSYASPFTMSRSGTAANPITLRGVGSTSVVNMGGSTLYLDGSYVHIRRLRITNMGFAGLWLRGAHDDVLDSLEVDHAAQELIALKYGSHHNIVSHSHIHHSGTSHGAFGEGVYVGGLLSGSTIWDTLSVGNQILANTFDSTWTEAIDVKGGADSTLIQGNVIDGFGTQFYNGNAVSLIAIVSNANRILGNTLSYGNPHGIIFFTASQGSLSASHGTLVQGNAIHLYDIHNYGGSLGVKVSTGSDAVVMCDNVVDHLVGGGAATNVTCTP